MAYKPEDLKPGMICYISKYHASDDLVDKFENKIVKIKEIAPYGRIYFERLDGMFLECFIDVTLMREGKDVVTPVTNLHKILWGINE